MRSLGRGAAGDCGGLEKVAKLAKATIDEDEARLFLAEARKLIVG